MKGQSSREKQAAGWSGYDAAIVVLRPYSRVRSEDGGYLITADSPRPPQAWGIALTSVTMTGQGRTSATQDGTVTTLRCILVGRVGSLVAVDDRFTYRHITMQVISVRHDPDGVYAEAVEYAG